jgi:UDP-3-O-[3-hydroxymyristoyl] glucosamine N-acyltransferase
VIADSSGVALQRSATLGDLVARLGGACDAAIHSQTLRRIVAPRDAAGADDLVLVSAGRHVAQAAEASGVLLCPPELAPRLPKDRRWVHEHPMWVVATLLEPLIETHEASTSRSARVSPAAEVAADASIAAGAVVMAGAVIGARCRIGENAVIYGGVVLGRGVSVGPLSVIGRQGFGFTTGPDGVCRRIPHLAGVIIEDDVEIGALCSVDAGTLTATRIGRASKLDSHVHVGHNAEIGAECLVAAQAGFAGSVTLEHGVLVGGQAGVADHARVGSGARVAAQSGVIGDVPPGAVVAGFPAVARVRFFRAMAELLDKAKPR